MSIETFIINLFAKAVELSTSDACSWLPEGHSFVGNTAAAPASLAQRSTQSPVQWAEQCAQAARRTQWGHFPEMPFGLDRGRELGFP